MFATSSFPRLARMVAAIVNLMATCVSIGTYWQQNHSVTATWFPSTLICCLIYMITTQIFRGHILFFVTFRNKWILNHYIFCKQLDLEFSDGQSLRLRAPRVLSMMSCNSSMMGSMMRNRFWTPVYVFIILENESLSSLFTQYEAIDCSPVSAFGRLK